MPKRHTLRIADMLVGDEGCVGNCRYQFVFCVRVAWRFVMLASRLCVCVCWPHSRLLTVWCFFAPKRRGRKRRNILDDLLPPPQRTTKQPTPPTISTPSHSLFNGTMAEHGNPTEDMCCLCTMEDITEEDSNYGRLYLCSHPSIHSFIYFTSMHTASIVVDQAHR